MMSFDLTEIFRSSEKMNRGNGGNGGFGRKRGVLYSTKTANVLVLTRKYIRSIQNNSRFNYAL